MKSRELELITWVMSCLSDCHCKTGVVDIHSLQGPQKQQQFNTVGRFDVPVGSVASHFLTLVGELAGEARCQPEPCTERYWSTIFTCLGQRGRTSRTPYQRDRPLASARRRRSPQCPSSGSGVGGTGCELFNGRRRERPMDSLGGAVWQWRRWRNF